MLVVSGVVIIIVVIVMKAKNGQSELCWGSPGAGAPLAGQILELQE